jgi:hypothetical protein
LFTFSDDWSFQPYQTEAKNRIEGRNCVKAYYEGLGDGRCPAIYPDDPTFVPLSRSLDVAKKLNASIYRDMSGEIEREKDH